MKKNTIHAGLFALSTLANAPAFATTFVDFAFDDGTLLVNPANVAAPVAGLSFTPWTVRDGSVSSLTGTPGRAIGANSFDANGTPGNEFRFQITYAGPGSLHLDGFSFDEQGSRASTPGNPSPNGAGPDTWIIFINDVAVGNGAGTPGAFAHHEGALNLTVGGPINFRIAAFGGEFVSSTWRIDNFRLTGTVVPLPASLPMLVGALGVVGALRRRRA